VNNRFVKNNIGLLIVTGLCALVALVVLVFVIIYSIDMYDNIQKLGELRGKISAINTKRPVPVEENKQPIRDDIEVYRNASRKLHKLFGRPLAPAVDRFFEVLTLKKSMWIPDGIDENDEVVRRLVELSGESQAEMAGKPQFPSLRNADFDRCLEQISAEVLAKRIKELSGDEEKAKVARLVPDVESLGEEALAKKIVGSAELNEKLRAIVPDTDPETLKKLREIPAKFTAEKFIEAFNSRVLNNNENDKNFADRRTRFDDFRRDQFENWGAARDAFIAAAENRPQKEGAAKAEPCVVEKLDAENADDVLLAALGIPRRLNGDAAYLKRMMNNISGQLVREYQIQIVGQAQGLGITSSPEGASGETTPENDLKSINPDDYPFVATHLDIISYMLYRVGTAGVVIWDVQIRLRGASESGEGFSGAKVFKDSFEQRDGFDIYHYTLEISGTMAEIRNAVKRLDDCYAVRRVYLVRNIALYAENNIVDSIFTGVRVDKRQQAAGQESRAAISGGRRRRPRSNAGAAGDAPDGGADDPAARQEEQKRLEEEYRQRQLRLDPDKRDGYGEPITAGGTKETFRAVIDVEYVVKAEK